MKKIAHKKIKNTGLIFELLVRKLTSDFLSGNENSFAEKLIEMYYKQSSPLGREYTLYQALIKSRFEDEQKAKDFLDEVVFAHKNIDKKKLYSMKYKLISEIRDNFDVDEFFSPKVDNYKLLASIFKVLESHSLNEDVSPNEVLESKYTIIENLLGKFNLVSTKQEDDPDSEMLKEFKELDLNTKKMTFLIMVEKFNETYSNLEDKQKALLTEYINCMTSPNILKEYLNEEIPQINSELLTLSEKVDDKVMKIKINEVCNQIEIIRNLKTIDDNHVIAVLNSYELIKELKELK